MRQQQQQTFSSTVRRRDRNRNSSRCPAGNALLDLAFVLPILLALTFGAVEYGYAIYVKHALQGAAREGVRRAIIAGATPAQVQAAVDESLQQAGFPQSKYARPATITPANWATSTGGTTVRVEVKATWSTIGVQVLPSALGGIDPAKEIKANTAMRREG
jgi:Flp pilus assembly protein TadG